MGLFSANCNALETDVVLPIPRSGTISNFNYRSLAGGKTGITITLRLDGTNTSITCITGTAPSTGGSCSDPTHRVPVTSGQTITIFVNGTIGKPGAWIAVVN
jgi:hypothetical protein